MVYMFNELSVSPIGSREQVCAVMETFINTYVEAVDIGFQELRLDEKIIPDLYSINLSDDYNIDKWLNDNRIKNDLRDKFRQIVTTSPLVTEADTEENEGYSRSEFFKLLDQKRHQVWGLGAAYLYNTISISLATHQEWQKTKVEINHYYLDENIEEQNIVRNVRHFATSDTLADHKDWYHEWQRANLEKSADLWNRRVEFFPYLFFLDNVEKQFRTLGDTNLLTRIINALQKFDRYAGSWKDGGFRYEDASEKTELRISPESPSTIRLYGTQRKITIPDLGRKLFDLHIKLGGSTRIHFFPDEGTKKIYIGYVGKHMRISSED